MTPTLGISFTAAGDGREVKIDEDCILVGVSSNRSTVGGIVSRDPKMTSALNTLPTINSADENLIASVAGNQMIVNFPCFKGMSLFVSSSAAGWVLLQFQVNLLNS